MSKKEVIRDKALEVLARPEYKKGIIWSNLIELVANETKENKNTCSGSLYNLPNEMSDKVVRPYTGLFILKKNVGNLDVEKESTESEKKSKPYKEGAISEPAKNFLLGEGECTHAIVVGRNVLGGKWGTPDILGAIRMSANAIYRPMVEIVAVEVKDPKYSSIEALGQAMAYKLFAHKTWLILPEDNKIERIKGIAITGNIGLITFTGDRDNFVFQILHRPSYGNPDPKSVNEMLLKLKKHNEGMYNNLMINEQEKNL